MLNYAVNTLLRLVVNEVWVDEEPISLIRLKIKTRLKQSVTVWYGCGKCGAMEKNVECLCCDEVEAMEYFELWDMRYCAVT